MTLEGSHDITVPTREFVGFVQSILQVYRGGCTLNIHRDYIDALILSEDNSSIILYAKIALLVNSRPDEDVSLNIRDLNKFILLSDFAKLDVFNFSIQQNYVYYKNKHVRQAKFILDEIPARKVNKNINVEWFQRFQPYFQTMIGRSNLKEISRMSMFANDSDKVYIYEENGAIVAELNDRQKSNIDSINLTLTDQYQGHILDKIILDINSLSALSSIDDDILVEVAKIQSHEALFFTIQRGGVLLKYLFASKIR